MKIAFGIWVGLVALVQAAGLDFPLTLKEIHAPADVKTVTADFEFTNRSNESVTVAKYLPTCSCIAVTIKDGKLRYAPGESGLIRAQFDMGNFSGDVDKTIALWLNNDHGETPTMSLVVRVHIPVLVCMEPKTLIWELDGKGEPKTIRITMKHTKPIRVISVVSSTENYVPELKTLEEGKNYEVIVTPKKVGVPGMAILRIETDCDISKHKIQQAFAVVRKTMPATAPVKP